MLDRLVAVSIVAHVHDLHLANLVDYGSVIAVVEEWRHVEYGVEHVVEHFLATHKVDKSLRVVEY